MFLSKLYKRQVERVKPLDGEPVEVQIMGGGSIDILNAFDISINGIGVKLPAYFSVGDVRREVSLIISLPHSKPFAAKGILRHVTEGDCFGVEFTSITKPALGKIQHYISEVMNLAVA